MTGNHFNKSLSYGFSSLVGNRKHFWPYSQALMICSMGVMPGGYREEHGSDSTRTIRTCY